MTQDIILKDQETAEKVADMIRTVDIFRHATVDQIFKTYDSPTDTHYTVQVSGHKSDIHAARAVSWITYQMAGWDNRSPMERLAV